MNCTRCGDPLGFLELQCTICGSDAPFKRRAVPAAILLVLGGLLAVALARLTYFVVPEHDVSVRMRMIPVLTIGITLLIAQRYANRQPIDTSIPAKQS